MKSADGVNVFRQYKEENSFTNGLFSLLKLSTMERPALVASFLDLLKLKADGECECRVRVLRGIDAADAQLRVGKCCLRFETKVKSGCLAQDQIRRRLRELRRCPGRIKRVVLLTPDDPKSTYVRDVLSKFRPRVLHLGWPSVYGFLEKESSGISTLSELVKQFLERIRERVFEQDFAGVISKVSFNDHTGVCQETYVDEMRRNEWDDWGTPRPYKELDGTGRKLLLYEKGKGITAEVEIERVKTDYRIKNGFPSRNVFAGQPRIFSPPISLKQIRSVPRLEAFGRYRKDRSPYRNLTREQYAQLIDSHSAKNLAVK